MSIGEFLKVKYQLGADQKVLKGLHPYSPVLLSAGLVASLLWHAVSMQQQHTALIIMYLQYIVTLGNSFPALKSTGL